MAKENYTKGAENGDVNSMYNIALIFDREDNFKQAEKYYKMAVMKKYADAAYNLAAMYQKYKLDQLSTHYLSVYATLNKD